MIVAGVTTVDKLNMNDIEKELNSDPEPYSNTEKAFAYSVQQNFHVVIL